MQDYRKIDGLLDLIGDDNRKQCRRLYSDHRDMIDSSIGSRHNHQAWEGGYLGHVEDTMNLACILYDQMNAHRKLNFKLEDALLVLFLHDLEKPWKYVEGKQFHSKAERHQFRFDLIKQYGIQLTDEQVNGMMYVEGEFDDYSPVKRVQTPLAAFCHMCDVASARIWFDEPKNRGW